MTISKNSQPPGSEQTGLFDADPSTLSAADSHVPTSPPPGAAPESKVTPPVYGQNCTDVLASFDPGTRSWKTSQRSLVETEGDGLAEFLETWPRSGTTRNGTAFQLPILAPRTYGTGFGSSRTHSIPTPTSQDHIERESSSTSVLNFGTNKSVSLDRFAKMFPTPYGLTGNQGQGDGEFGKAIRNWPTPKAAASGPDFARMNREGSGGDDLATAVARWPTPTSRDWKDTGVNTDYAKIAAKGKLAGAVMFPTPQSSDHRDRGNLSHPSIQRRQRLGKQLNLSMVVSPTSGQLNPTWVEWLMGFPLEWTVCDASETPSSQK